MKHRSKYYRPIRRPRNVVLRSKFKMERRQQVRKISRVSLALGGAALLCWLVWITISGFLFNSDNFKIRSIDIRGNTNITANEIIALLPFREGDNLFRVWLSAAEKNIIQCKPELKKIGMSRRWQRVLIEIEERRPLACVVQDNQRLGLDEDNVPFPLRGKLSREFLPAIVAGTEAERLEVIRFIKVFAPQAPELFRQIVRLYPEPVNDFVFDLKDNLRIYWGPCEEDKIKLKLRRLTQVLADARTRFSGIEYVNLAFFNDGRIILKPRNGAPVHQTAEKRSGTADGPLARVPQ
jgi:cell division protein FtsQ